MARYLKGKFADLDELVTKMRPGDRLDMVYADGTPCGIGVWDYENSWETAVDMWRSREEKQHTEELPEWFGHYVGRLSRVDFIKRSIGKDVLLTRFQHTGHNYETRSNGD